MLSLHVASTICVCGCSQRPTLNRMWVVCAPHVSLGFLGYCREPFSRAEVSLSVSNGLSPHQHYWYFMVTGAEAAIASSPTVSQCLVCLIDQLWVFLWGSVLQLFTRLFAYLFFFYFLATSSESVSVNAHRDAASLGLEEITCGQWSW